MMKVEQVKTPDDIERYIEGCLNDFETAISTKDETVVFLAELVVHIYKEAKKEQCNTPDVVGRSEQFYCTCSRAKGLDHDEEGMPYCIECQKPVQ
jgi:hypothetical protein